MAMAALRVARRGARPAARARRRARAPAPRCARPARGASPAPAGRERVRVRFSVARELSFGESMMLVGSTDEVGAWDTDEGLALDWHEGDVWTGSVTLAPPSAPDAARGGEDGEGGGGGGGGQAPLLFKLVVLRDGAPAAWEEGEDRALELAAGGGDLRVTCEWGDTRGTLVEPLTAEVAAKEALEGLRRARAHLETALLSPIRGAGGLQEPLDLSELADELDLCRRARGARARRPQPARAVLQPATARVTADAPSSVASAGEGLLSVLQGEKRPAE